MAPSCDQHVVLRPNSTACTKWILKLRSSFTECTLTGTGINFKCYLYKWAVSQRSMRKNIYQPKATKREMFLDAIYEADEQTDFTEEKKNLISTKKPAIFKHKEVVDVIQAERDIQSAREEWESIKLIHPGNIVIHVQTQPISCDEVLDYFKSKNMEQYLKRIQPVKMRKGFEAFKYWIAGPPRLNNSLIQERDLFFAIAMCPFNSSDDVHIRVLQTLYKALSGSDQDCPRYGKHWEDLGFQGIDPGTDLRGVGFLGLVHLLYFLLNPSTTELAKDISKISKSERQNFPFCTMGINMSRIVLETMREESLNRECNKKMNVFQVTNDFYAGIFLRLYIIWREQNKTVMDSGFVIKGCKDVWKVSACCITCGVSDYLNAFAKKHSSVILRDLFNYENNKASLNKKSEIIVEFSNINHLTQVSKV